MAPPAPDPTREAPELGETIRAAQAQLERAILEGRLQDDPIRFPLSALSTMLGALHRLFVDGTLTLEATLKAARQPIDREAMAQIEQTLAKGVISSANEWTARLAAEQARAHVRRNVLVVTLTGFVLLGVGFAGGWAWQARNVADVQRAMTEHQDTMPALQREASRDGQKSATQWVGIVAYNHLSDVTDNCKITVVNGRRRCETAIWIDPEPESVGKAASR